MPLHDHVISMLPPKTAILIALGYSLLNQNKAHCCASIIMIVRAMVLFQYVDSPGCSVATAMHSWMRDMSVLEKETPSLNSLVDAKMACISC